jgi:pyruvate formate lyase activating enzyme
MIECPVLDPASAPEGGLKSRAACARDGSAGYVHSFQTGSVVDGPGMRFVLWTTGCLMRCLYCHNPDTWHMKQGRPMTVAEVMAEVGKYERFMQITGGGVTVSGGEPLVQAGFVCELLRACKARGLHTVLDTNGYLGTRISDDDLEDVDLVLLDIKSFDPETHQRTTGIPVDGVLRFARRLSDLGKPAWIRFVLVPGLTDDPANVDGLAAFVATLDNVERVEVLPFHQMGQEKWERLGRAYPLAETRPPEADLVERVRDQFRAHGLPVR